MAKEMQVNVGAVWRAGMVAAWDRGEDSGREAEQSAVGVVDQETLGELTLTDEFSFLGRDLWQTC